MWVCLGGLLFTRSPKMAHRAKKQSWRLDISSFLPFTGSVPAFVLGPNKNTGERESSNYWKPTGHPEPVKCKKLEISSLQFVHWEDSKETLACCPTDIPNNRYNMSLWNRTFHLNILSEIKYLFKYMFGNKYVVANRTPHLQSLTTQPSMHKWSLSPRLQSATRQHKCQYF